MLSRAFHVKSPRRYDDEGSRSRSRHSNQPEEDGTAAGGEQLTFVDGSGFRALGLKEVVQCSVQMLGESELGISEKVVLWGSPVFCAKRFRSVSLPKGEFGRRLEVLARVTAKCKYLVPLRAYGYAKRTKVVLCDYFAMGSLADLLEGARTMGHTQLDWNTRFLIILHTAKAIAFIHWQSPNQDEHLQMNVHGNIKSSNVLIRTDFSACMSDYGFIQLAERAEFWAFSPRKLPGYENLAGKLSQKTDIYNFGAMVLDILGGPRAPSHIDCIIKRKEEIKEGVIDFFEFPVEGSARRQAFRVLEMAFACRNESPEKRPSVDHIMAHLKGVFSIG